MNRPVTRKQRRVLETIRRFIAENDYINLEWKVEDQKLWQRLFALGEEYQQKDPYSSAKARKAIKATITDYLSYKPTPWTTASSGENKTKY